MYVLHCEHEADSTHRMRAVHVSKLMDDGRELISDGVLVLEELRKERKSVSGRRTMPLCAKGRDEQILSTSTFTSYTVLRA